jgi:hypothetical protein
MVVEFLKSKTLAVPVGSTIRYMSCEKRYAKEAKFIRFSNNVDYTILESKATSLGVSMEYVQLLMAFSHWTYKVRHLYR